MKTSLSVATDVDIKSGLAPIVADILTGWVGCCGELSGVNAKQGTPLSLTTAAPSGADSSESGISYVSLS